MLTQTHALHKGTIFAVVALLAVVSATSLAMSNSVVGNSDNANYVGTRDVGVKIAQGRTEKSTKGHAATWGVFAYRSDRGLSCVQAGVTAGGKVGAYSEKGFRPFSPADSIGNCDDLTETLATMGGAVYAASAPATDDPTDQTSVVYGVLADDVTRVTVTIDQTQESVPVELNRQPDQSAVSRSFVAPLPPEVTLPGITVTFERGNGERSVSTI